MTPDLSQKKAFSAYIRSMPRELLSLSYSMAHLPEAARQLLPLILRYRICVFSGGLGAGKTTLIHALCAELQVPDAVSSPTFALINEYHYEQEGADRIIYHMDWYRLRDAGEATDAGMEDCLLQTDALCLVEWPERAPELLHSPYLWIRMELQGESERLLVATEY